MVAYLLLYHGGHLGMRGGTIPGQLEEIDMGSLKGTISLLKSAAVTAGIGLLLVLTITPIVYANKIKNGNLECYTGHYSIRRGEVIRGWVVLMDNGKQYRLNVDASDNELAVIDWLYNNQDKQITIAALPPRFLAIFDRAIVSVSMDETLLLNPQHILADMRVLYIVFLPFSIIIVGTLVFGAILYILDLSPEKKKSNNKKRQGTKDKGRFSAYKKGNETGNGMS